ncbi:MAG: ATP-dependent exoDNAse [Marmoricola sp.]|nr:ATP-dependent exoDNAse [Marmoricola sp.]
MPVTQIEAAVVRHYTSRAGDPHRHLHLQINARVLAEGAWRGLHSVGMRDSLAAINGIGHAAVATDPEFRSVLTAHGFTLDPATGELTNLAPYVGRFSARTAQIGRNLDRYEAEWRHANPGAEPGPGLRQAWDRRAWAQSRPDQVVPTDGAALVVRWNEELHDLGYTDPPQVGLPIVAGTPRVGGIDRDQVVEVVLSRLEARRSAWNAADIRGEVEQRIAGIGLVADATIRVELAEDLTARTLPACQPLLPRTDVPEHIRALTSPEVLAVEADLVGRLIGRAEQPAHVAAFADPHADPPPEEGPDAGLEGLDVAQRAAVASLAGSAPLLVVEGAAGAGKTKTLSATGALLAQRGHRMVVVTPTLKAAKVAGLETGTMAFSAAWLAHQHGFRWDDDGHWTREAATPVADAALQRGGLRLIDEAGMLDQDTARAILTIADETGARIALVGDPHQLPAVGRGGVLDLAARWARPETMLSLDVVHRFTDPKYAELSLAMRTGVRDGEVFDALVAPYQVQLYPTEAERTQALAEVAARSRLAGETGVLVRQTPANRWRHRTARSGTDSSPPVSSMTVVESSPVRASASASGTG